MSYYADLLACYRSGQISEQQWQQHLRDKPIIRYRYGRWGYYRNRFQSTPSLEGSNLKYLFRMLKHKNGIVYIPGNDPIKRNRDNVR
jgi:hypothetical protein